MDERNEIEFPELTPEDLSRINKLFAAYIFYHTDKQGVRRCTTTCCNKEFTPTQLFITEDAQDKLLRARHNDKGVCPLCGSDVTIKSAGKSKTRKNLLAWSNVAVFHTPSPNAVYAQAFYAAKDYRLSMTPEIEFFPKMRYLFTPGEAKQWKWAYDWMGLGMTQGGRKYERRWVRTKTVCDPFPSGMGYITYMIGGHTAIGLERLDESFLQYCAYGLWLEGARGGRQAYADTYKHWWLFRYLAVAARHPQIETMVKLKMEAAIEDLVVYKRVGRGIDWSQKDLRKALGLTRQELKHFAALGGSLQILRLFQKSKRKGWGLNILEVDRICDELCDDMKSFWKWLGKLDIPPKRAMAYLNKFCTGKRSFRQSFQLWLDYLEAAEILKYDLQSDVVKMPKNLVGAHDLAAENRTASEAQRQEKDMQALTRRLEKKFAFESGQYIIRVPKSMAEIIREGRELKHCVGGYAARHAEGKVVILFLRDKRRPAAPLVTIEMNGKSMRQIHGFSNDNNAKQPPRVQYAEILEPWLAWVEGGSKRDRDGNPIVPAAKQIKSA